MGEKSGVYQSHHDSPFGDDEWTQFMADQSTLPEDKKRSSKFPKSLRAETPSHSSPHISLTKTQKTKNKNQILTTEKPVLVHAQHF